MTRCLALVLLALAARAQTLEIAPTFNSGAILTCGSAKFVLDTVFRGLDGYQRPGPDDIARMQSARPPYDGPLVILATHNHADHFDADLAAALLAANPRAQLVATSQVAGPLAARFPNQVKVVRQGDSWSGQGTAIRFVSLPHSGTRWATLENTGHLITMCGQTVFHPGDADLIDANFARALAGQPRIDIALVPEWFLAYGNGPALVDRHLQAKQYYALHGDTSDLSWIPLVRKRYPAAVIPAYYLELTSLK